MTLVSAGSSFKQNLRELRSRQMGFRQCKSRSPYSTSSRPVSLPSNSHRSMYPHETHCTFRTKIPTLMRQGTGVWSVTHWSVTHCICLWESISRLSLLKPQLHVQKLGFLRAWLRARDKETLCDQYLYAGNLTGFGSNDASTEKCVRSLLGR